MVILSLERDNQTYIQPINIEETVQRYLQIKGNLKDNEQKTRFLLNNELYWIFPFNENRHDSVAHKYKDLEIKVNNNSLIINGRYFPFLADLNHYNLRIKSYWNINNWYLWKSLSFPTKKKVNIIGLDPYDSTLPPTKQIGARWRARDIHFRIDQQTNLYKILFNEQTTQNEYGHNYVISSFSPAIQVKQKFDLGNFFIRFFKKQPERLEKKMCQLLEKVINFIETHSNLGASYIIQYYDFILEESYHQISRLVTMFERVDIDYSPYVEPIGGQFWIFCHHYENKKKVPVSQSYISNKIKRFNLVRMEDFITRYQDTNDNTQKIYSLSHYYQFKLPTLINYCHNYNIPLSPIFKFNLDKYELSNHNQNDLIDVSDLNLVYLHLQDYYLEGAYCENRVFTDFINHNFKRFRDPFTTISVKKPQDHICRFWITNNNHRLPLVSKSNHWFIFRVNQSV